MSENLPQDPRKIQAVTGKRLTIYLSIAVAILIAGLFISPSFPDELIAEVVLIIVIAYIEIRKKIKNPKK